MKDTQIKRVVYGDNHAFKEGVEVGRKEMIEKTELWLLEKGIMYVICESDITDLIHDWRKAMEG